MTLSQWKAQLKAIAQDSGWSANYIDDIGDQHWEELFNEGATPEDAWQETLENTPDSL